MAAPAVVPLPRRGAPADVRGETKVAFNCELAAASGRAKAAKEGVGGGAAGRGTAPSRWRARD